MTAFNQSLRRIPFWAYLLVLVAIFVITVFIYFRGKMTFSGSQVKFENGHYLFDDVRPGGPVDNAGIRKGDTLLTINSIPIDQWAAGSADPKPGDTLINGILRNNHEVGIPVILNSVRSYASGFFWFVYIIMVLFSIGSLFLIYKKPKDRSVTLLFIYIQIFIVTLNAQHLPFTDPLAVVVTVSFQILGCFLIPTLVHFHLLFPKPVKIISRCKRYPLFLYLPVAIFSVIYAGRFIYDSIHGSLFSPVFEILNRIALWWLTSAFILALLIATYQFFTVRDTLSRNQLRIVFTGAFFSCITPIALALFYTQINALNARIPYLIPLAQATCGMTMIFCFLVAIFRYRIWDIEVIIRKALLYLGATMIIIMTYLFLIWIVDLLIISENNLVRFVILSISVIVFLVLRDKIQRLIDRLFQREAYDSASVASDFEEKLAGVYRFDELKEKIFHGLDDIFHFSFFTFHLKKENLVYEPVYIYGVDTQGISLSFEIAPEVEDKLRKSKVFSPEEIKDKPPVFNLIKADLVVPLISGKQPAGFFLCGQKKSERIYSRQDIQVLSVLARRVIALLHTANLYQKDLDRQLLLERERARIAQDMHDDIGAGLTKIAMMSEKPVITVDLVTEIENRKSKIASSARELISKLNVIVWALNPKYDNLESLLSYLRRFFSEYLENFGIEFKALFGDFIPEISITPDTRRNIFYAVQEAIHNAVKHSGCSEIGLVVKINQKIMEITVIDNGKGFDTVKPGAGGNGLLNMKKRAEELGGSFEIISGPGKGTQVIIRIKRNL